MVDLFLPVLDEDKDKVLHNIKHKDILLHKDKQEEDD